MDHGKDLVDVAAKGETASFRCLVCDGSSNEPVFRACADYYLGKPFRVDYVRCQDCGLLQQFPVPADVSAFYEDYPIHVRKSALYDVLRRIVMSPVYYKLAAHPRGTKLLDYGCGDGGYLDGHRDKGFVLLGYENDVAQAARLATWLELPVYSDLTSLLQEHEASFDVLTMHFALEHLTDLHGAFACVRRLLRPGGTFYFVVPHVDSLEARVFGRKWHNLDPPRHISLPDARAVRRLADRHGFALTRQRPVPFPNGFAASMPALLVGRFTFPLFALFLPLGILLSRLLPTGARAYWLVRD